MNPRLLAALTLLASLVAPSRLLAADAGSSLWSMISQGGWAMYPLALCSLTLIYLVIHCGRETRKRAFGDESATLQIASLCGEGSISDAVKQASSEGTRLGRSIANGLRKAEAIGPRDPIESVENEIFDSLEIEENEVGQWIHYLSITANVAPMIGLLGTVSGMIGGFQTMASGGMGRPELFAGDIGEALITTATGLCIGIPAMVAHAVFSNRLNALMVEAGRRAGIVLDALRSAPEQPRVKN